MARSRIDGRLAAAAIAVAAAACGPVGGTEGRLGHGSFFYECRGAGDTACLQTDDAASAAVVIIDLDLADGEALPSAVAVGGRFGVSYQGDAPETAGGARLEVTVVPASPSLVTDAGGFAFTQPATVSFLARGADGTVADFTDLRAETVETIELWSQGNLVSTLGFAQAGETRPLTAVPRGPTALPLGGSLSYQWTTSDPAVATVTGRATSTDDEALLTAAGPGEATITVTAAGRSTSLHVTVGGAQ